MRRTSFIATDRSIKNRLYTSIRNPLPYNVVMRVLSTDPERIHIWPSNSIIPGGGAMDIAINFEPISIFRKERILVKIINLPQISLSFKFLKCLWMRRFI
ncbi:unnamed protein product [Meloidogyne enterolobii]|uniref:Uncharacterized protein n=2 Tax=Meloidogyne enterolobii TaxID=390850 RepID=A0ACB0YQ52_MELEN